MEMFFLRMLMNYVFTLNSVFLQDSCQSFMAQGNSHCANIISKCILWMRGLVPLSEF